MKEGSLHQRWENNVRRLATPKIRRCGMADAAGIGPATHFVRAQLRLLIEGRLSGEDGGFPNARY